MANLAARRKMRNAKRFGVELPQQQQRQPPAVSRSSKVDTRQANDPEGIDASTAYKLEEFRVKNEKELASLGNEALVLVYGYNSNLYEDVFALSPKSPIQDIERSYEEQISQLKHTLATVFTSDVPDDEINGALSESQMQTAASCGMTPAHMEKMHPRNFVEVKMDALKRAFDILNDEQSRIEYDAVLLEFQELSTAQKLGAVVKAGEKEEDQYEVDRDIDYGEHGDYSYDESDAEEEVEGDSEEEEDDDYQVSYEVHEAAFSVLCQDVINEDFAGSIRDSSSNPESPTQTVVKHPWKQEQLSPRDPFEFEQQYDQSSPQDESDHFDPFDLKGADRVDLSHLPMIEQFSEESNESVHTEVEALQSKRNGETVTVFKYALPEVDDDDEKEEEDITVGEVIEARGRGEEVVLPLRPPPNMDDMVPRKKKGIKPKLRSLYQSMKRSVGGSAKSSRSITSSSDSPQFQSKGVRVMSLMPPKKKDVTRREIEQPHARSQPIVTSIDPQGPNLSMDEDDEKTESSHIYQTSLDENDNGDDEDTVRSDTISELTKDTTPPQQQSQQPQEVVPSNTDREVETFLNMANDFRAMDGAKDTTTNIEYEYEDNELASTDSDGDMSMTPQLKRREITSDASALSTDIETKDDYLKHYPMKSLLSVDDEDSDVEDYEKNSIFEEWVGIIDEIEDMCDDSLEGISSIISCEK